MSRAQAEQAGRRAEQLAAWLLRLKGYRILGQRWRTPVGEIDVVARKGNVLVFVEVKRRDSLAAALAALTPQALVRVRRAAEAVRARVPDGATLDCRFDAVLVAPRAFPRHLKHIVTDG
jgi:putative endonuclease